MKSSVHDNPAIEYIREVLKPFLSRLPGIGISVEEFAPSFEKIVQLSLEDLTEFVSKDPAARGRLSYVWNAYGSPKAVVDHRIAHEILCFAPDSPFLELFFDIARALSEESKERSGIEIHPSARIGGGFRIDHGFGTVVGEQVEIGRNCVLLQGVTLGARSDSEMTVGRRHPRLGNGVKVFSFAKVLGPVDIGDGCFIGPECVVLDSLAAGTKVLRQLANQVVTSRNGNHSAPHAVVYGVRPGQSGRCTVFGQNLAGLVPAVVDRNDPTAEIVRFNYVATDHEIDITDAVSILETRCSRPLLILRRDDGTQHSIHDSPGLDAFYGALAP